jgi:hypothetical protein
VLSVAAGACIASLGGVQPKALARRHEQREKALPGCVVIATRLIGQRHLTSPAPCQAPLPRGALLFDPSELRSFASKARGIQPFAFAVQCSTPCCRSTAAAPSKLRKKSQLLSNLLSCSPIDILAVANAYDEDAQSAVLYAAAGGLWVNLV